MTMPSLRTLERWSAWAGLVAALLFIFVTLKRGRVG